MDPTSITVKKLFARCRNRCAFPRCSVPIVEDNGIITGIICHIRTRSRGGPRFGTKRTSEQRHAFENLIVMCSRHTKVIDSEPRRYTAKVLEGVKTAHEQLAEIELSQADGKKVDVLLAEYREINIVAQKVVFKNTKSPTIPPPAGSIGSDLLIRNYSKHLIERYNDFASNHPGRNDFSFAAMYSLIKKRYRVGKWELVPVGSFDDLC